MSMGCPASKSGRTACAAHPSSECSEADGVVLGLSTETVGIVRID